MGNVIIVLLLTVIVSLIIRSLWKQHKNHGGCTGNCTSCHQNCHVTYRQSSAEQMRQGPRIVLKVVDHQDWSKEAVCICDQAAFFVWYKWFLCGELSYDAEWIKWKKLLTKKASLCYNIKADAEVVERQTRCLQAAVRATAWEFKSLLLHQLTRELAEASFFCMRSLPVRIFSTTVIL